MNYLKQINLFWKHYKGNVELTPTAYSLYFALLDMNNRNGWKTAFNVEAGEVMHQVSINSTKTFYDHLERLQKVGLIYFKRAKNQYAPSMISIVMLDDVPTQNLEQHFHSTLTACSQHTAEHSSQNTDNQYTYEGTKLLNNKTNKQETKTVFQNELFEIYQGFYFGRTQVKICLEKRDEDALRSISEKLEGSADPLSTWSRLFDSWTGLPPYFQSKISLEQIERNLLTLIDQTQNHDNQIRRTYAQEPSHSNAGRKDFDF